MNADQLKEKARDYHSWVIDIRRHLHQNPEVSYQEHETTRYILSKLEDLGIPAERPLETGCVGIINGGRESDRVVALRADIDALDMEEEGEAKKEFLSKKPGTAHCCGHDAHTANLLGAARILKEMESEIEGTVLLIFQPAEENLPGGGRLLTESGFLQKKGVQKIFGLHMNPVFETGQVATRVGPLMARPDEFVIELFGKGGHAASPHMTVDPIVMASQVVMQFQTIVSRSLDPTEPAVVTIGHIKAGSTYNVISSKALLEGTVRTFERSVALTIRDRMEAILKGVTESAGGDYAFHFNEGYPAVRNDPAVTDEFKRAATLIAGDSALLEMKRPIMAGEDFAFYQEHFPGTFYFLGSGSDEADSRYSWHHPRYNIDENCFLTGVPLMAGLGAGLGEE